MNYQHQYERLVEAVQEYRQASDDYYAQAGGWKPKLPPLGDPRSLRFRKAAMALAGVLGDVGGSQASPSSQATSAPTEKPMVGQRVIVRMPEMAPEIGVVAPNLFGELDWDITWVKLQSGGSIGVSPKCVEPLPGGQL